MSQHSGIIANADGATVRADIQAAVQALLSLNGGAAAPATTYAGQLWADATNHVLKRRNEGNSAWAIIDTLDTDRVLSKTGAYTVKNRDVYKLIEGNTTAAGFTFALPAIADMSEGVTLTLKNTGTGSNILTVDGNAAETINGSTTLALADDTTVVLTYDGTEWLASVTGVASSSGMGLIASATASASSSIDFTGLTTAYFAYYLVFDGVVFSASNTPFLRTSIDNGSTFTSAAGSYAYANERTGAATTSGGGGANSVTLINLISSTLNLNSNHSGKIIITNPANAGTNTGILARFAGFNSGSNFMEQLTTGQRLTKEANNAIRFAPASGTITTGNFKLYGLTAA